MAACDLPVPHIPVTHVSAMSKPAPDSQARETQARLVACAKNGDQQAFATLFDTHKSKVYSLCLLMTGNPTEAEDLTQDAFIQVFRKLATFRGDSAFSTWLYRIAVNTVLMNRRRRKPRQISLDEPIEVGSSSVPRDFGRPDLELSGAVDRIALLRAINELPEGCRRIFVLHEVEGYQHHEIAGLLNCSAGNSKSQLHKARMKLRELLLANGNLKEAEEPTPTRRATPRRAEARILAFPQPASAPSVTQGTPPVSWDAARMWALPQGQRG